MATKEQYMEVLYSELSITSSTEYDTLFDTWWSLLETDADIVKFHKIKKRLAHKLMSAARGKVDVTIGTDKYSASQELKQAEALYKAASDELDKLVEESPDLVNKGHIRTVIR